MWHYHLQHCTHFRVCLAAPPPFLFLFRAQIPIEPQLTMVDGGLRQPSGARHYQTNRAPRSGVATFRSHFHSRGCQPEKHAPTWGEIAYCAIRNTAWTVTGQAPSNGLLNYLPKAWLWPAFNEVARTLLALCMLRSTNGCPANRQPGSH